MSNQNQPWYRRWWVPASISVLGFAGAVIVAWLLDARMGDMAAWAAAAASTAAVLFAVHQVSKVEHEAALERAAADRRVQKDLNNQQRLVQKQIDESDRRWTIDRLLELSEALHTYDMASPFRSQEPTRNTVAQIRALVSALPGHYAVLTGHIFEIPRANHPADARQVLDIPDFKRVLGNTRACLIEVEWNLQVLQGTATSETAWIYLLERYNEAKQRPNDGSN